MIQVKQDLAMRLRVVRLERFGEQGVPELARLLGVPPRTWSNYESGVTIPGDVLLAFLVLTDAEPEWLLRGNGATFWSVAESPGHPAGR